MVTPEVLYFSLFLIFVLAALVAYSIWEFWSGRERPSLSPYTGKPLRRGEEIPYFTAEKVLRFLYERGEFDNQMFDLRRAALCRDTGRLFPEAIRWDGKMEVDWSFLQRRYPGNYRSWGSLTELQRGLLMEKHGSLAGFQLGFSSAEPSPAKAERRYLFAKPGPLYVDLDTATVLGWQCVPGTDLEVLIVQKPKTNSQVENDQ